MSSTPELCQNCGASLPPDSRFCDSCGAPAQKQQAPQQAAPEPSAYQQPSYQPPQSAAYQQPYVPPPLPQKDSRKTLYIILAVVAVLILLGCGACVCLYALSKANGSGYEYNWGNAPLPQAWSLAKSLLV